MMCDVCLVVCCWHRCCRVIEICYGGGGGGGDDFGSEQGVFSLHCCVLALEHGSLYQAFGQYKCVYTALEG